MMLDGATVLRGSRVLQGEAVVSGRAQSAAHASGRGLGVAVTCGAPSQRGPPPARVVAASTSGSNPWGGNAGLRSPGGILSRFLEKGVGNWRDDSVVRTRAMHAVACLFGGRHLPAHLAC